MSSAPFFIIGSGRSGSTLLRMILASHSRLAIPPETWFLLPLLRRLPLDRPLDDAEVEYAVQTITSHYRWPDMRIPVVEFHRRVCDLKQPLLRDIVELVYQEHMRRDDKPRWGDKTPGYIEVVPHLAHMFPGSRFIHLCRDGRDVAKSFQRTGWYGPWLHDNTREWNEASDYRERWSRRDLNDQILDVHYEDLVLDSERLMRSICDFLNERFEPQILAWQARVTDLLPAREIRIHDKLKRLPVSEDINRWRREMTTRELLVCEAFMGKRLERAGYEPKLASPLWAPIFPFIRWYCTGAAHIASFGSQVFRRLRKPRTHQATDLGPGSRE